MIDDENDDGNGDENDDENDNANNNENDNENDNKNDNENDDLMTTCCKCSANPRPTSCSSPRTAKVLLRFQI